MKKETNKTAKPKEKAVLKTVDATGLTLGRVATTAAVSLLGKDRVTFERHVYSGSPVKVINASKIRITAKKLEEIYHTRYSGIPGGLKIMKASYTVATKGMKELVRLAIYDMLPPNKLRPEMMKNLKIED